MLYYFETSDSYHADCVYNVHTVNTPPSVNAENIYDTVTNLFEKVTLWYHHVSSITIAPLFEQSTSQYILASQSESCFFHKEVEHSEQSRGPNRYMYFIVMNTVSIG